MVVGGGTGGAGASTSHSLRMRGLPYQANEQDVEAFFEGFKVAKAVVVRKNGKPTGEGYAFFHSEQEASAALQRKNRESMGNRYIELFLDGKAGGGASVGSGGAGSQKAGALAGGGGGGAAHGDARCAGVPAEAPRPIPAPSSALHSGMTYAQASRAQAQVQDHQQQQLQAAAQAQAPAGMGPYGHYGAALAQHHHRQQQGSANGNGQHHDFSSGSNSLSSTPPNGGPYLPKDRAASAPGGAGGNAQAAASQPGGRPVVVRVRGLPFSAQDRDVRGFFEGLAVRDTVFTLTPNGRPTGEAFVEFAGTVQLQNALAFQKQMLGKRYIEIFKATKQEFLEAARSLPGSLKQANASAATGGAFAQAQGAPQAQYQAAAAVGAGAGQPASPHPTYLQGLKGASVKHVNNITGKTRMLSSAPKGTVLKLRGLPYTTEEKDIRTFFAEYGVLGVVLMTRPEREGRLGTCNGVAYVQFLNAQEAEVARQSKHKEMMGNRYIECMTHIPKGAPAQGQQEGGTQQAGEAFAPAAEQGGVPVAYQQQQPSAQASSQPASAASSVGAESGEYLLPNDFFRNINKGPSVGPQYYGGEVAEGRSNQQVWPTDGKQNGAIHGAEGGLDPHSAYNMPTLQQQLEKMGLSEKGESLFSAPGPSLLGQQQQAGATTAAAASFAAVGGAHPPGYGPADSWGGEGIAKAGSNASSGPQDDPLGGAMVDNGNGNGAVYPGWSSGIQGQQQQGFATGYSPILDSRFKHLW